MINIIEDLDMEGMPDISEITHYDQYCIQAHTIIDNILRIDIRKGDGTFMKVIYNAETYEEELYAPEGANEKDTIEEVEFLLGKLYLKAKDAAVVIKEWKLKNNN